MDLPSPVSQKSYERIMRKINLASREVADDSMKKCCERRSISFWNVIGDVTGKVIDVAVLSSYCKGCEKWRGLKSGHLYEEWKLKDQPHCVKNHIGSSSKMEVDGMKEIFQRSVPQRNAKYIKYIGDGDTKTFSELQRTAPYSIENVECVGHIQKRMGARLRKLKTMNRGKNLSDGKSISGKNRLTDKFIDTITTYYGNAIRQNNSSVSDMRQAIWAIYCHYISTDEEPMHHFCPIGDTSWCKYQKAVATNSASLFKHKNIVPIAIMDEIKPIIAELSAPKLLKKCVGGKTPNANESFNSTVWKYCPKTSVCGSSKNIVDIAVNEVIVMFNEGMTSENSQNVVAVSRGCQLKGNKQTSPVLLSTAIIKIKSKSGKCIECRALIDNASQLSLISGRLKEKLDIPVKSEKHKISGINGVNAETSLHSCRIEFTPHFSSLNFNLEDIVVHKVTSPLPIFQFKNRQFPHLKNLKLADPNFHISKPIDVLLDAEIYADLLEGLPIFGPAGTPTAIPTKLGYILSGKIYAPPLNESIVNSSLNDQLSEL
ncbi:uncharacterized protein TNCV_1762101 [Trichonephila clavipes]|nr:uncharacterized protein TNCV_1762101 [Trichonephila clavipes]